MSFWVAFWLVWLPCWRGWKGPGAPQYLAGHLLRQSSGRPALVAGWGQRRGLWGGRSLAGISYTPNTIHGWFVSSSHRLAVISPRHIYITVISLPPVSSSVSRHEGSEGSGGVWGHLNIITFIWYPLSRPLHIAFITVPSGTFQQMWINTSEWQQKGKFGFECNILSAGWTEINWKRVELCRDKRMWKFYTKTSCSIIVVIITAFRGNLLQIIFAKNSKRGTSSKFPTFVICLRFRIIVPKSSVVLVLISLCPSLQVLLELPTPCQYSPGRNNKHHHTYSRPDSQL